MRVHLIKKDTIEGFVRLNARSKPSFAVWLSVLKTAD
jgi:mRNA interferase HigB